MGRCYEFGVVIAGGCDHAMVVSPEGGACVCGTCGAACTGRFRGCDAILAMPGHVPVAAPKVDTRPESPADVPLPLRTAGPTLPDAAPRLTMPSVGGYPQDQPTPHTSPIPQDQQSPSQGAGATLEVVPANVPQLAEVVDLFERMLERPDRAVELISQLRSELGARDDELAAAFDRLTAAHQRVADELAAEREARERLITAVDQVAKRMAALEERSSRPLFPGLRRVDRPPGWQQE